MRAKKDSVQWNIGHDFKGVGFYKMCNKCKENVQFSRVAEHICIDQRIKTDGDSPEISFYTYRDNTELIGEWRKLAEGNNEI